MSKYRALICVLCLLFVPTLLLTETATKKKKRKPKKPAPGITPSAQLVPVEAFNLPDGLEVSVWATSPMFYNPTNMDVDHKGRIWVTEAINYRNFRKPDVDIKHPEGDPPKKKSLSLRDCINPLVHIIYISVLFF